MTYKRKCDNWLVSFRDWIAPRSEAPDNYMFWGGAFAISSALRRNVFIGQKTLGGWTCYPHLYTMFVGPPGMRKTTSMLFAVELLGNIQKLSKPPTLVTREHLVDSIISAPDAATYLAIEEFSDLIQKGGKEMYELLTSLFDAKKELSVGTMMRGREGTERPCVNMLACTTPEWISSNMPAAIIGGGFASRVIWVYEDKVRIKGMYWNEVMASTNFDLKKAALISDLDHIATNLNGEFTMTPEALKFGEEWYQNFDSSTKSTKLQGYYMRKPTHLHKLAQIFRISYSDELVIEKSDLEASLSILELIEPRLLRAFEGVGKNTYSLESRQVEEFIKAHKTITQAELLDHFRTAAEPMKLYQMIEFLCLIKKVRTEHKDGQQYLHYIGE